MHTFGKLSLSRFFFWVLRKGRISRLFFLSVGGPAISSTADLSSSRPQNIYQEMWLLSEITQVGLKIDGRVSLRRECCQSAHFWQPLLPPFFGTCQSIFILKKKKVLCLTKLEPWNYQKGSSEASKGVLKKKTVSESLKYSHGPWWNEWYSIFTFWANVISIPQIGLFGSLLKEMWYNPNPICQSKQNPS